MKQHGPSLSALFACLLVLTTITTVASAPLTPALWAHQQCSPSSEATGNGTTNTISLLNRYLTFLDTLEGEGLALAIVQNATKAAHQPSPPPLTVIADWAFASVLHAATAAPHFPEWAGQEAALVQRARQTPDYGRGLALIVTQMPLEYQPIAIHAELDVVRQSIGMECNHILAGQSTTSQRRMHRRSIIYDDPTRFIAKPSEMSVDTQSNVILSKKWEGVLAGLFSIGLLAMAFSEVRRGHIHNLLFRPPAALI